MGIFSKKRHRPMKLPENSSHAEYVSTMSFIKDLRN